MSQTSAIAGGLIIAFIVFITVRGQLPCYLNVLGISNQACKSATGSGANTSGGLGFNAGVNPGSITVGSGGISIHPPGSVTIGGSGGGITIGT